MAEYIEREAAIAALPVAWDSAVDALRYAPAADVATVVHGEWRENGLNGYAYAIICSKCGYIDGYPFNDRSRYCPNCGAKMDGGVSDG